MWSKQHRSFTIITISCLSMSNALLLFGMVATFRVTPNDVMFEVQKIQSEIKISTEATRSAVAMNESEIKRLREQMRTRTEQLRRANEALLKLDPNFKIDRPDDE